MNSPQKETPPVEGRGWYSLRATDKPWQAPVALRNTTKTNFEVSRYEIRL